MQKNSPVNIDPTYNRNLLLSFVIIMGFMVAWYYLYELPHRKALFEQRAQAQQEQALKQAKLQEIQDQRVAQLVAEGKSQEQAKAEAAKPAVIEEEAPVNAGRVKISTPKLHGSINLLGARIDDATLANYRETMDTNSPEVNILVPQDKEEQALIETGFIGANGLNTPTTKTVWKVDGNSELTAKTPVTIYWVNPEGVKFTINYAIDEAYMLTVTQGVENNGTAAVNFFPYSLISKTEPKLDKPPMGILHTGPLGVMDQTLTEVSYHDLREEKKKEFPDSTGWIGITDKYWAKTLIPQADEKYKATFRYTIEGENEKFQVDYLGQQQTAEAGKTKIYTSKIFIGAKELSVIEHYKFAFKIPLFDRVIDFGWFYFLAKPLMKALIFFSELIGNFGLAILALTFCVKLLLFPLARKSYISMGQIRELAPKIQAIREKHKDNKMEQNQKMMELYKKERVNPASGCLPILLQMPIFFALYKVFYVSIEMRHTPFFGWINDLSAPDPTSFVNLFGALPFDPPSFLIIGAWPVLWAFTMYIQQKISPQIPDPIQAKMMKFLPLVLMVVFAKMPAGLVIYWTFSNILTIGQQLYFLKFHHKKK